MASIIDAAVLANLRACLSEGVAGSEPGSLSKCRMLTLELHFERSRENARPTGRV